VSVLGDPTASVTRPQPYAQPTHPHVYTGSTPKRWCRIIVPGRVGSDRRRIELDDGTELTVALTAVIRTTPCHACGFTGRITRILEPKQPAITAKCTRCHGLGRHPMPGQPPAPATRREPGPDDDFDIGGDERIDRSFANKPANRSRRPPLRAPDWARESRGRGDWS
jgi:hypothetical protein